MVHFSTGVYDFVWIAHIAHIDKYHDKNTPQGQYTNQSLQGRGQNTRKEVYFGMSTASDVFPPTYIHFFYAIVMHFFEYIDGRGVLEREKSQPAILSFHQFRGW